MNPIVHTIHPTGSPDEDPCQECVTLKEYWNESVRVNQMHLLKAVNQLMGSLFQTQEHLPVALILAQSTKSLPQSAKGTPSHQKWSVKKN